MTRHLLAGLALVFLTGTVMANSTPSPGETPSAETATDSSRPNNLAATTTAGSKEGPIVQARKPDDKKLNKLKVYPCF